ncbi:MAG: DUF2207 domain-containing protein, partial [Coriobacteriia bacterium]
MHRSLRATFIVLTTMVALCAAPVTSAQAKSYTMPSVAIETYVEPTGDVRVVESRTFDFNGSFSWVQWKMLMADSTGLEVLSVKGPTGDYSYVQTEDQGPGTYTFWDDGSAVYLKLFHGTTDAQATFVIEYRALGAAKRYSDTAELYWQFIGDESEVGVGSARINIHLPGEYAADDIKAWAHGPLTGTVYPRDGGFVEVAIDDLPPSTFVEPRVLFPADGLSQATLIDSPRRDEVLAEESAWAEQANQERRDAQVTAVWSYGLGLGVPLLSLLGAFVLWWKHGRERTSSYPGGYYRELPADLAPAIVGALWRFGTIGDAETVATLMDLSNRGVITVEPETETTHSLFGAKTETTYRMTLDSSKWDTLRPFEQQLMSFLFTTIANGETLTIAELNAEAKSRPQTFATGMTDWRNSVSAEADRQGFFETTGGTLKWVLIVGAMLLGVFAFFASGFVESWWPFALGIISAIGVALFG